MAEKECIEREAALDIVNGWREQLIPTYGKNDEYVKCLETVADHLESLHAVNVRPVILCKDCTALRDGISYCMYWGEYVNDSGYCSYGKKREES